MASVSTISANTWLGRTISYWSNRLRCYSKIIKPMKHLIRTLDLLSQLFSYLSRNSKFMRCPAHVNIPRGYSLNICDDTWYSIICFLITMKIFNSCTKQWAFPREINLPGIRKSKLHFELLKIWILKQISLCRTLLATGNGTHFTSHHSLYLVLNNDYLLNKSVNEWAV